MKKFLPTYLYVKEHTVTKLKYFGKTTKKDPSKYRGSGKYWLNHLKVHGNIVTTKIIGYYEDENECMATAIKFSIDNNIVDAVDKDGKKIWANQVIENGIDGGATRFGPHTEETKNKIRESQVGKKLSDETKNKIKHARHKQKKSRVKGEWRFPESSKDKLRVANLGKKQSKETILKRAEKLKGRTVSDEVKLKISKSKKGKPLSPEHVEKLKKRVVSEETKLKISKSLKNKSLTMETRNKLKDKIVCINLSGEIKKISKELFYAQVGEDSYKEWVFHRSSEGTKRKKNRVN